MFDKEAITTEVKEKILGGNFIFLKDSIATKSDKVFKITKYGDLVNDGYEVGYLYIPTGYGIKLHKHINDIEKYTLITGVLSVQNKIMNENICLINEKHCIDEVPTDTIIMTCKVSKKYLEEHNIKSYNDIFNNIISYVFSNDYKKLSIK